MTPKILLENYEVFPKYWGKVKNTHCSGDEEEIQKSASAWSIHRQKPYVCAAARLIALQIKALIKYQFKAPWKTFKYVERRPTQGFVSVKSDMKSEWTVFSSEFLFANGPGVEIQHGYVMFDADG